MHLTGGLAQLVERVLSMHEVSGSIPEFSTRLPFAQPSDGVMIAFVARRMLCLTAAVPLPARAINKADGVRGSNLRRTAPGTGARPSFGRSRGAVGRRGQLLLQLQ